MNARFIRITGVLLAVCAGSTAASGRAPDLPQAGVPTSHRTKSIDQEFQGAKYLKEARIQPAQARALALKAFGGDIIYERIEKKPGGSGLRYSFVIRNSQREERQVDIDANDGTMLENTQTHRFL
jgi:uncharacterized membrane protein YkoI